MKTRRHFKKEQCAPSKKKGFAETCYKDDVLFKLKNAYNRSRKKKITVNTPKQIWYALKTELEEECDRESCWAKTLKVDDAELKDYTFSPKQPQNWKKNKNTWLSNYDIIKVMTQYEHAFPEFKFLGPSPIDFDVIKDNECVWNDLCNFHLKTHLNNGKQYLGIVFNLDTHDKGGSHWVAGFIDVPKQTFYYFDSTGERIPKEVSALVHRVKQQFKGEGIDLKFKENRVEHQKGSTECGMYVLYFIAYMLVFNDYSKFNQDGNPVRDQRVESLRHIMFNKTI